ncbi:MAG TPA: hypothetical protein VF525_16280 [Pyrinomonadaceae bacterium]
MNLTEQVRPQIDEHALSLTEQVRQRCQRAKEREEMGDYAAAVAVLGDLWPPLGERPPVGHLDEVTQGEALLRVGTLTGFIGSARRQTGAQETAKDLISAAAQLFAAAQLPEKVAEAQTDLAYCYWREGAYDEARATLRTALTQLSEEHCAQRATALQRLAIVESSSARYNDALRALLEAAPLFDSIHSEANKGKFHMELAVVYDFLSAGEQRADYADQAFIEYTAASIHLEQSGHISYLAANENNFGFFLFRRQQYADAHTHLAHARRLFTCLQDDTHIAQVDDTRAHVLLAEGHSSEAERVARDAVRILEQGGRQGLLAEALTTHGAALARTGQVEAARATLARAFDVAEQAGELEGAGRAALTTVEELAAHLAPRELRELYIAADELLKRAQDPALAARMRACARHLVEAAMIAPAITRLIAEANARHGKSIEFTPAALETLGRLPLAGDVQRLCALIERTAATATDGSVIDAPAVEVVALRQTSTADLNDPWASFSLKDEVQEFEERLIELALRDAHGMVSHAARLLGFKHHETLNWRLKHRNKNLLDARKPIRTRRRSIITKQVERKQA